MSLAFKLLCTFIISINAFALNFELYNSAIPLLIKKMDDKSYICSSVAINKRVLLTAAHCLEDVIEIKVSQDYEINDETKYIAVDNFFLHPKYNPEDSLYAYDLGIITLKEDVLNRNFYPINQINKSAKVHRVGFGARNGKNSRTVITGLNKKRNTETCLIIKENFSKSGDSGGPIFQIINGKYSLVAIHSTLDFSLAESPTSLNPLLQNESKWINEFLEN